MAINMWMILFFLFSILSLLNARFIMHVNEVDPYFSTQEIEENSVFQVDLTPFQGDTQVFYQSLVDLDIDLFSSHPTAATLLTHPQTLNTLLDLFPFRLSFKTLVANVSDYLLQQKMMQQTLSSFTPTFFSKEDPMEWFNHYHPFEDIQSFYNDLKKHFPNRVRIIPSIGYSHEGRPIMALAISEGQNETRSQSQDPRPQFYIQGGIHAREWISHATLQYISFQLASSSDAAIVSLLEKGEFLIVPVMNPDGYVYTWNRDRLWRKNRRPNADHSHGVDLNRNFDARWGHEGTSKVPSSETYCGPFSASEPEVQAVSKFFESQNGIVMALDLHSYSQLILRPIGWTNKDSPHEKQLKKVGKKMAQIIQSVHDKLYISEKSVALYPTTGAAHDWFYMQKKTQVIHGESYTIRPYAMTIELRPTAEWFGPGFILDASEIIPTGEEILPAVLHLANYSLYHPLWTKKSFTHSSLAESILFSPYLYFLLPFLCFVIWTSRTLFASSKKCQNCTEKKPFMTESEKKNSMKEVL